MRVTRIFTFSAAHHLTQYHGVCERPHGHTYRLAVTVEGQIKKDGLVLDFMELKKNVEEAVLSKLDHRDLNDFFENPSAENIAVWIWKKLDAEIKNAGFGGGDGNSGGAQKLKLAQIKLWEGDNTYVTYDGN